MHISLDPRLRCLGAVQGHAQSGTSPLLQLPLDVSAILQISVLKVDNVDTSRSGEYE